MAGETGCAENWRLIIIEHSECLTISIDDLLGPRERQKRDKSASPRRSDYWTGLKI